MAMETPEMTGRGALPPAGTWKVRGRFTEFDGTVTIAERPEESRVEVEMQTASITTDTGMRDDHLRSDDFLEVDEYPTMTFRSKELRPTGDNTFELVGDLTIKGISMPSSTAGAPARVPIIRRWRPSRRRPRSTARTGI